MENDDTNCTGVVVYGNNSLPNGVCNTVSFYSCNTCITKAGLRKVISNWIAGGPSRSSVAATYGLIEDWDLSEVTNMKCIFYNLNDFNADISKWDTSAVTTMQGSKHDQLLFCYFVYFGQIFYFLNLKNVKKFANFCSSTSLPNTTLAI